MSADLKRKFLKMLKEDETFRYAVMAHLGIEDIRASLSTLTENVNKLTISVSELTEAQRRLTESLSTLTQRIESLAKEVGSLSSTIGFRLEDIARVVVPGWLYRHEGIKVELERKFIYVDGEEIELNLYEEGVRNGEKIAVIGEAKHRIYGDDVRRFQSKIEKVRKVIKGEVYKLMFGFLIHHSAEKEAEKRGIRVIAS